LFAAALLFAPWCCYFGRSIYPTSEADYNLRLWLADASIDNPSESSVPTSKDILRDRLARYRQIKITVIGRKSGRKISLLVWFVFDRQKLYLLPVRGSDIQWYKNLLQNPSIRIDARGVGAKFRAAPITNAKTLKWVADKFREKYGAGDVKRYYSKFDVAVLVKVG
jgi:hypothetical protein